jgi:quercetin dioxygenase-like cupin family protein
MKIIRGKIRVTVGVEEGRGKYLVGPGNFIYIPPREVHGIVNCNDSESAEWIFMCAGVQNKEAPGTEFI